MLNINNDTIVAIGTRPGEAAIGIVKLSGGKAAAIVDKIFKSKNNRKIGELKTFSMTYGYITDNKGNVIDEVIVSYMKEPNSYTREDVVEINSHGGIIPTSKILQLCIENGARIAEPGEFTKRAFLNGRIDLSQAEAVIDIVRSKTEESLKIAAKNVKGEVKRKIRKIASQITDVLIQLEASVDFIEEDLELTPYDKLTRDVQEIRGEMSKLIKDEEKGEIIKNGVKVAIIGKPNVGKSSLLNLLSKKEKAIVTPIPGTTRDAVEEILYIRGIPLILMDTAGIRKAKNKIEKIGVERSLKHIDEAELVICVMDISKRLEDIDKEIIQKIKGKRSIIAINKVDLKARLDEGEIKKYFDEEKVIKISATQRIGIEKMENRIKEIVLDGEELNIEEKIIINNRHKKLLKDAEELIEKAESAMKDKMSEEFPSADLKIAKNLLGEITGDTASEDILEQIFSQFCIGK
ncbi:MAG: tRNA uridine-5-carboxymethylaminomethyl(34) synthesis GTPase MnmE [Actinomycetota bacterium]